MIAGHDLDVLGIIGIILLIGIVKKNAIMMIDFALDARARGRPGAARGDLPGLAAALSAHPDDHDGGAARRAAADAGLRRGLGAAPPARHRDRRRADREPAAHAVHDAGDLSGLRPRGAGAPARRPARARPRRRGSRRRHEPLRALHRAPGRDHAVDRRASRSRARSPTSQLPVSPLPQVDYPDHLGLGVAAGRRPARRSPPASPRRSSGISGEIADVTEITSQSSTGQTRITLQFDLDRDINGAARDVQAAINAARRRRARPACSSNPTYRKVNPADAPIMILALTSKTLTRGQLYDAASNVLQQRLSQLDGIGQVSIGGATLPAVRVELNPTAMFHYGIGLEDVRAALASANANSPKGAIEEGDHRYQLYTNDQASHATDYRPLIDRLSQRRRGAAVRRRRRRGLGAGSAQRGPAERRALGARDPLAPARRQHHRHRRSGEGGAAAAAGVAAERRQPDHRLDRSPTIRASLRDTEVDADARGRAGDARRVPAPSATCARRSCRRWSVPVSLIGTFGGMYLLGFSLDNLSLMALTIATGFVVDDAIVVLENISRHVEAGMPRREAALRGAKEVGFTVVSISVSLVAVFIPILLMGGIVGPAVPRVHRDPVARDPDLDGDLAHHDADDVRAGFCACRRSAGLSAAPQLSRSLARLVRAHPRLVAAPRRSGDARAARHDRAQRAAVHASSPRASSRRRIPGSSSAASSPTRASRSS